VRGSSYFEHDCHCERVTLSLSKCSVASVSKGFHFKRLPARPSGRLRRFEWYWKVFQYRIEKWCDQVSHRSRYTTSWHSNWQHNSLNVTSSDFSKKNCIEMYTSQ